MGQSNNIMSIASACLLAASMLPIATALHGGQPALPTPVAASSFRACVKMQYGQQYGGQAYAVSYAQQGNRQHWQSAAYGTAQQGNGQYGQSAAYGTWNVFPRDGAGSSLTNTYQVTPGMEQILGRFDMVETLGTKLTVSRQQAAVQVGPDGTATVYSIGKPPTGFRRSPYEPWAWLQHGQSMVLSHGCKISLDAGDPEGAVYKCEMDDGSTPGLQGLQGLQGGRYGQAAGGQGTYVQAIADFNAQQQACHTSSPPLWSLQPSRTPPPPTPLPKGRPRLPARRRGPGGGTEGGRVVEGLPQRAAGLVPLQFLLGAVLRPVTSVAHNAAADGRRRWRGAVYSRDPNAAEHDGGVE